MKKLIGGVVLLLILGAAYYFFKYKPGKQRVADLTKLIGQVPSFDPTTGKTPVQLATWIEKLSDSEYKAISEFLTAKAGGAKAEKDAFAAAAAKLNISADQVTLLIKSGVAKLK